MIQALKLLLAFVVVFLCQLYLAPLLKIINIRPDFILILLVFISSRYGRITGILIGFSAGLMQDVTGSLSVLGANSLPKSIVGYTLGTLNGNLAIWTPRVISLYIYGSLLVHALIYQLIMIQGMSASFGTAVNNILLEALMSSVMITGMRYLIPLVPSKQ
ncbi:MAG: rod shape-determining protein MreD [Candidatus Neomarinimicrobiota bacterium]